MEMKLNAKLLGVRPSSGSMRGEDGETVSWDQIEIHTLAGLDEARGGVGHTVQIHKLKGAGMAESATAENLKRAVGKEIGLNMAMTADGKGGTMKMVLKSVDIPSPQQKAS